jgi:hypothetical protein
LSKKPKAESLKKQKSLFRLSALSSSGEGDRDHALGVMTSCVLSRRSIRFLPKKLPKKLFGGGERDRTDDLLRAKQALSQLSYTPPKFAGQILNWWA